MRRKKVSDAASKPSIKHKREPLPMKLRALPQSFWQQPNTAGSTPPSSTEVVLPLPVEEPPECALQVSPADTDLLFSLFRTLKQEPQEGVRPPVRRGRPKKVEKGPKQKDEDPYVTSATVPEVKFQKEAMVESKVLALMAFHDNQYSSSIADNSYAQRLQDLAVNL